jgi:RNA polymerase sigma-70 factor (ECF subfamily)
MSDRERQAALDRARRGDRQALGELLDGFRPYVRAIAHALRDRRVQARLDDSDLVQDALLAAHRGFADFRGATVAEFTVWLRRVVLGAAGHTVRDQVAAAKRDPARERPAAGLEHLLADGRSSPSDVLLRHEQAAHVAAALARLPDEMQQVLLARHVDGLPHAAVAERLQRSEGAVRMLYLRALRRLRDLYRE